MNLFQIGDFTLHSGSKSKWKIDCDALTDADWDTLALMVLEIIDSFKWVEGVPKGGLKFAKALEKYANPESLTLLIVDDVNTTGNSLEKHRNGRAMTKGIVFINRGSLPVWCAALFTYRGKE